MSKQKDEAIYRNGWNDGFAKGAAAARFQLEAENAELRELVREMMRFFEDGDWCTTCESAKECEAQEQYEEDCLMRGAFHDRMRELGVEYNYMHESRPPRTLAELFGVWRNCDDEEDEA